MTAVDERVTIVEPTAEQCTVRAQVGEGRACWYPQMGGYAAKAIVFPDSGCADVWVWHDGSFPFAGEDGSPAVLHHCNGDQFVAFGEFLREVTA